MALQHSPGDRQQHGRNRRPRDVACVGREHQHPEQHSHTGDNAGEGGAATDLLCDRRAGKRARAGVARKQTGREVGDALAEEFLVAVDPIVAAPRQRLARRDRLHQTEGSDRECAHPHLADHVEVGKAVERGPGQGRQAARNGADNSDPVAFELEHHHRDRRHRNRHQGRRDSRPEPPQGDQQNERADTEPEADEVGLMDIRDDRRQLVVELRFRRLVDLQQVFELAHRNVDRSPGRKADEDGPRGERDQRPEAENCEADVEHSDHHSERAGGDQKLRGTDCSHPEQDR